MTRMNARVLRRVRRSLLSQPPECGSASSCRVAPAAQPSIYGAPSSATFTGTGNLVAVTLPLAGKVKAKALTRAQKLAKALKACQRKKQGKRRAVCEKSARKRYGSVKAKRSVKVSRKGGK